MSDLSLSGELPNIRQALVKLPDAFDFSLDLNEDSSSLGSDSEVNGMVPYRQMDRYGFIGGSSLKEG